MPDTIDVRQLLTRYTVEELNRSADEYFHQFSTPEAVGRLLAKPFICPQESPELLISFGHVMQGLQLVPGQTVLDFGAGSCWSSRYLTQLGYRVIATDVSETALRIGRQGFDLYPVQGDHHPPTFLPFDGHRFDLPDASIDRVLCLSAFHHVPNQATILREMARVLKPGGIAGFSEPGPNHSKSAQSQHEMRNFAVVENDIHLDEIWPLAEQAGFSDIEVAYWTPGIGLMPLADYLGYARQGRQLNTGCARVARLHLQERSLFFLHRGEPGRPTSRQARGLAAEIEVALASPRVPVGQPATGTVRVRNIGSATWLPAAAPIGAVNLGVRRHAGWLRRRQEVSRHPVPSGGPGIRPGDEVVMPVTLPPLPPGRHELVFDLVAELVTWFEQVGSRPARVVVEVV